MIHTSSSRYFKTVMELKQFKNNSKNYLHVNIKKSENKAKGEN